MSGKQPPPIFWARIGVLAAAFFLTLLFMIVSGTRTTSLDTPKTAADGIRCALLADQGGKPVRCSQVLDARPEEVLALVRDYAQFGKVFEGKGWGLTVTSSEKLPNGQIHFLAQMSSLLGTWPIDAHIVQKTEGTRFTDSWDDHDDKLLLDRGFWAVEPAPGGGTLLTYQLEVDLPHLPSFFVRDVLLIEMRSPLRRIGRRLGERHHAP